MRTTRNPDSTVLVMAASTRTGSTDRALARQVTDHLHASATAELVDLREYPMPLNDGDVVGLDHTELDRFAQQAVSERSAA